MNCVRLTTGYRVPPTPERVDVFTALKVLEMFERNSSDRTGQSTGRPTPVT